AIKTVADSEIAERPMENDETLLRFSESPHQKAMSITLLDGKEFVMTTVPQKQNPDGICETSAVFLFT
ncbi:MAG: hypothetical protein M1835_003702, partial [Candelina submexicana]